MNNRQLIIIPILMLCSGLNTLYAQGSQPAQAWYGAEFLVLDHLLEAAESGNAELRSAHARWEATVEKSSQAGFLPDPRLSYGYFAEEVQTRTGPQTQKFGVSQTFPWAGKRGLAREKATRDADAAYQDYLARRLKLAREIRVNFYEYAYLSAALTITREHLELLKLMESVTSVRYAAGRLPQSTLIQIQVEAGKLEDRIQELESLRIPISSRISAYLNRSSSVPLPWPDISAITLPKIDESVQRRAMLTNNPSLKKIDIYAEKEIFALKLAKKAFYPDITVGLDYITVAGGDDPVMAMVSLNLPVWRNRLKSAERESMKRRAGLEATYENSRIQFSADLDLMFYQFHDAVRKTGLYRDTLIPKAEQAIEVALKGFETGNVSYADLVDAERSYLEFQLTGVRKLADAHQRRADIEALTGRELIYLTPDERNKQ